MNVAVASRLKREPGTLRLKLKPENVAGGPPENETLALKEKVAR